MFIFYIILTTAFSCIAMKQPSHYVVTSNQKLMRLSDETLQLLVQAPTIIKQSMSIQSSNGRKITIPLHLPLTKKQLQVYISYLTHKKMPTTFKELKILSRAADKIGHENLYQDTLPLVAAQYVKPENLKNIYSNPQEFKHELILAASPWSFDVTQALHQLPLVNEIATKTAQKSKLLKGHEGEITDLLVLGCQKYLISADNKKFLVIWDLLQRTVHRCFLRKAPITSVALAPNGREFVTGEGDSIFLWNLQSFTKKEIRINAPGFMRKICFLNDNKICVTLGAGLVIFDTTNDQLINCHPNSLSVDTFVILSADTFLGKSFFTNTIYECDFWTNKKRHLCYSDELLQNITLSQDKQKLYEVCSFQPNVLMEYDIKNPSQQRMFANEHASSIRYMHLSNDGTHIITGSDDNSIKIWDLATGKCVDTLIGHPASVIALETADREIISGDEKGNIFVWRSPIYDADFMGTLLVIARNVLKQPIMITPILKPIYDNLPTKLQEFVTN